MSFLHAACTPALRQNRTDHELDLMEQHQRQDDSANRMRREDYLGHRDSRGARLFLEPQKTIVMRSAAENSRRSAAQAVETKTAANKTALTAIRPPRADGEIVCQIPSLTASLKAT